MKKIADKDLHINDKMGMGKNEPWKIVYKACYGSPSPADVFNPYRGKDRPSTHIKVNECDH